MGNAVERAAWVVCTAALIGMGAGCAATGAPESNATGGERTTEGGIQAGEVTVRCPVSGGDVQVAREALRSEYKGQTYYFCCASCKADFDRNPALYLSP